MKRACLAVFSVSLLVACSDGQPTTSPGRLWADFSDGRTATGNKHFFFLPPLVGQPTFSGAFNAALKPVVEICELVVTAKPFSCASGRPLIRPGPAELDATGQQYRVNWDTRQPAIDTSKFYRILVRGTAGGDSLGFADMDPVANGSKLKNVNTGEYIGLVDGRILPIKFRIERGAFGTNCSSDCAEASVTNDGGTVITNTGFAGALFPPLWIRPDVLTRLGITNVVVSIERVNLSDLDDTCIPLNRTQAEGCYRFKTFPDVGNFADAIKVTVGICVEVEDVEQHDGAQLFKVEELVGEGGGITLGAVTPLENAPAPFVTCEGFAAATPSGGPVLNFARGMLHRVGSWLTPSSAFAAHVGAGGLTGSFSRIGWVLPTAIDFDVAPGGEGGTQDVTPGTEVNTLYASEGVRFGRTLPGAFCRSADETSGNEVFANDHGPLPGGGFGFNSGNNVVTVCPEGTSSDFSENEAGRIEASFDFPASQVCINAYPTGFHGGIPGSMGLLAALDGEGEVMETVTTAPGVAHVLCIDSVDPANQIWGVQFAGSGAGLAMFDNLSVTFSQPVRTSSIP